MKRTFPKTANRFHCITTYVDCFTNQFNLFLSKTIDSAVDVANKFFAEIFRLQSALFDSLGPQSKVHIQNLEAAHGMLWNPP